MNMLVVIVMMMTYKNRGREHGDIVVRKFFSKQNNFFPFDLIQFGRRRQNSELSNSRRESPEGIHSKRIIWISVNHYHHTYHNTLYIKIIILITIRIIIMIIIVDL